MAAKKKAAKKKTAKKTAARKTTAATDYAARVTAATLAREAKAMKAFTPVNYALGDVVADAHEIATARADLADLKARRFPVSEHTFQRIQLLLEPVVPLVITATEAKVAAQGQTAKADAARLRMLDIRRRLALYGELAGLPAEFFRLGLQRSDRINPVVQRVSEVLAMARKHQKKLPDPTTVRALLDEGERLVREHTIVRIERAEQRGSRAVSAELGERYARLLLDTLQHVSRVGLAAYPDDPTREKRYRLDHLYANRTAPKEPASDTPGTTP